MVFMKPAADGLQYSSSGAQNRWTFVQTVGFAVVASLACWLVIACAVMTVLKH
ncbi:hypothetical protein [Caulobacter sp. S45]|jgi:hypothetical protein|uniref:hypothetical protein n=1 Tax=Caulobacter sp. S45 TaxID=1641861 RepID=UPI00131BE992|nr:hypothetical protein [Caulobacter sp. S45]